jgi:ubiquinone/menaquinone biosynthesis C-methylase UbiE
MKDSNSYTAIARVYDKLNKEIDYVAWADFFEACFDRYLKSRPSLLLDLACGTGSMTIQLAKRGYDMIGIDGSTDMLSEAYGRA